MGSESEEIPSWEGLEVGKSGLASHDTLEPTPNPSQEGNAAASPLKNLPLKAPAPSQEGNLRAYLGEDVFQWLCACAVYPELHWNLTLSLAALPCMPANLLTEANLLRLIRLPWFREGALPEDLRLALINELGPAQLRDIRTALIALLERQDPPPPESVAYDVYQLHLAVQRLWLLSWRKRRKWKQRLKEQAGVAARRVLQDYTFVRFLESERVSPVNLVLPRRLRKLFFRQGVPWFGLKTSVCAALTGVFMALVLWQFPTPQPPAAVSDFVMHTFQVADLPAEHPAAVVEEGVRLIPASSTSGYLCYGPLIALPAIDALDAHFSLALDNNTADDRRIAVLQIYDAAQQQVLHQKALTRRMFQSAGAFSDFKVSFGLEAATQLEFRVFYAGGAALKADTITLANPAKTMEMVWVEGGCFQMGSLDSEKDRDSDEGPVHEVCLDGFWMGKYEVTPAQWQKIMDSNPSWFKGDNRPVEAVSWNDAQEFINILNSRAGATFRLPTEAEWEYAARAGSTTAYSFGNDASRLGEYAWYSENSGGETHPVGQKKPNAWGLHDMHGNVWEWCQDWYGAYAAGSQTNPQGPASGSVRVLRGGSWNFVAGRCRSADRSGGDPGYRADYIGFRLLRTPS